jgi:hypothetical protein
MVIKRLAVHKIDITHRTLDRNSALLKLLGQVAGKHLNIENWRAASKMAFGGQPRPMKISPAPQRGTAAAIPHDRESLLANYVAR